MRNLSLALVFCAAFSIGAMAESSLPALPSDGFVTLEQIVRDFKDKPEAALQKYNGLRLCVYGRVGDVAHSEEEAAPLFVRMRLADLAMPSVKAVFDQEDIPSGAIDVAESDTKASIYHRDWNGDPTRQTSFIIPEKNVAIRGTFDNFVAGDIILKNSFKLSPEALAQKLAEHGIATE
jgi:hypothetical protein